MNTKVKDIIEIAENGFEDDRVLPYIADFVRLMNGGRITSCKNAKDRTSQSTAFEQSRWLQNELQLPHSIIPNLVQQFLSPSSSIFLLPFLFSIINLL